ncbi:CocE/NonD family hydrolase [Chryseobacterium chendengshani]|uniref:CocE/NonD family hydrolase n=1 Tax=Chryseobacterium sp. LJ668 TaxID=2864040 RepID=UPI001C68A687|nr:CocE/NonD family hydrolase [Chryseobacterium sp. LJ668]MBW8523219.1 CocE/NonD family hydrolase [Chryseobacterium sp. LJ668]QYK15512.1 CocE/NonD family hydrolase [Chryseobacterium sp. LJ668]
MKIPFSLVLLLFFILGKSQSTTPTDNFVKDNFTKKEMYITMRDGVKLFTAIYIPKDISKKQKYPFLMQRTCYSIAPYGENEFKTKLGPNPYLMKDKYIFVYQDVRGRYMSQGTFTNMTPQVERKTKKDVDESTDTYDTIDWLVKNIKYNNGKVGQYGTSYPGFYTAVGTLAQHPSLVASSPQAPISDFWNDDFLHNGKFMLGYFKTFPVFGVQKTKAENKAWYSDSMIKTTSEDGLKFYRDMGTLKEAYNKYYKDNFFMTEIMNHPNYDEYWQKRSLLPHLKNINHAVITVGGWFDAEDLSGPLNIYKTIEKTSPKAKNTIVMGPFSHGGWGREEGKHFHNQIYFGDSIATYYQKSIETKFFNHYLKGDTKQDAGLPEALMYDTGAKKWKEFAQYPPKNTQKVNFYLVNGTLKNNSGQSATEYYSDPDNPVLSSDNLKDFNGFTPRNYMSEDQRFAVGRPDVLTFTTDVLTEDMTFAGEIMAKLNIASTSTDADFALKLIDVYPEDFKPAEKKEGVVYGNYHQMVRSEIMPARFRNSRERAEALVPNQKTAVNFRLQDVVHTFKKGHRIQIQISSTWFPLFSVNPQKFLDNPNVATKEDYTKAFIKVFEDSSIEAEVLK